MGRSRKYNIKRGITSVQARSAFKRLRRRQGVSGESPPCARLVSASQEGPAGSGVQGTTEHGRGPSGGKTRRVGWGGGGTSVYAGEGARGRRPQRSPGRSVCDR